MSETQTTSPFESWGLSEDATKFIQTKGFKDAESIVKSYQEAEKFIGMDKNHILKIPRATEGVEVDYTEVYTKLGRPEKSDGYELPDTELAKAAREKFFQLGLSAKQAKELAAWADSYADSNKPTEAELQAKADAGKAELTKAWGKDFDLNVGIAKQAVADLAQELKLDANVIDILGDTIGLETATKIFYMLGKAAGAGDERNLKGYVNPDTKETPETANEKVNKMRLDPEFTKKIQDPEFHKEYNRLNAVIAQGKYNATLKP